MTLERFPVVSSHLKTVAHDGQHLYIEFQNGNHYRYENVPVEILQELRNATSPGQHFQKSVKGTYEHVRLPNTF